MKINKKNALRLWEMCFGDDKYAEDFHGYLMCRDGYGNPDYFIREKMIRRKHLQRKTSFSISVISLRIHDAQDISCHLQTKGVK